MPRHATALVVAMLGGAASFGGLAWASPAAPDASAVPSSDRPVPERPASGKPAPVILANHKAVYDLSLASSGGTRAVESARGRIVIDFKGDACRGYTMQTRQVTVLESGESGGRTSDLRNTTFEGGEARDFRFRTVTVLNGDPSPPVDGTAESSGDTFKVRLKEPKKDQFTAGGPVLFPSLHMRRLVQAARAGETTMSAKVFDGSDDGRKVYDTLAIIGRRATAPASAAASERDRPLHGGAMAAVAHWPVTLSYFTQGEGERTPIYTLTFDLYENGVSGALKLDYGDFAILGDMTRLDLDTASDKPCAP